MSFGVTTEGFSKKTLDDILSEIRDDERDAISSTLNLLDTSVLGQLNGVFGDKLRELWNLAEAIYRSQYPDSASGEALDQVASITGATRLPATQSVVQLDQLNLDDGVTVPAGSIVSIGSTGARWELLDSVTNSTGAPGTFSVQAQSEDYGAIQGLSGTIDTIVTPISGWSAAAAVNTANSEPFSLADAQTLEVQIDGGATQTVTFSTGDFVDIGNATAQEVADAINADITGGAAEDALGEVRLTSDTEGTGSSVQIVGGTANPALGFPTTLVVGFNSADAEVGRELETDADFRLRRIELLRITGAGSVEAIRARVRELDGVVQAYVFENVTMVTDPVTSLPPKSFEVVVSGGDNQDIADTIWEVKPAGIESYGSITESVQDSMGFFHDIKFSRPTLVPIYIDVTVSTNPSTFPADGADQIKAALKALGDSLQIGDDVIALQFKCAPLSVTGVIDVTDFKIDTITPPVGTTNIAIGFRDLAEFDTSWISVTVT